MTTINKQTLAATAIIALAALVTLTTLPAAAQSWEDPLPSRTPASASTPIYTPPAAPAPVVRQVAPAPTYTPPSAPRPSNYDNYESLPRDYAPRDYEPLDLFSQHLDTPRLSAYTYGGAYIPETVFGPYGTSDVIEVSFDFRLFKYDDFLAGTIDLRAFGRVTGFLSNPEMSNLPDALLQVGLDLGMAWRFDNGWSTEIRAAPGIYSDAVAPAFGIPATLNFYFAVNPQLSIQLGGTIRAGWDIPFMPNIGIAWQPADEIRIEAGVPKSKITLFGDWMLSPFATFEWRNTTYALDQDIEKLVPEDLTLDEMLVTAGIAFCPMRTWTLTAEYGKFIQRELSADVSEDTSIDLSKESIIRIMIKGEF